MFKVGDKLRCIETDGEKGCGWKKGREFIVKSISEHDNVGGNVYWPTENSAYGIYERAVELVNPLSLNIMSSIKEFAKNLILSADEKLLRSQGLKTECGDYTQDAKDIVMEKLAKENEAYLIEIAKAKKEEEK